MPAPTCRMMLKLSCAVSQHEDQRGRKHEQQNGGHAAGQNVMLLGLPSVDEAAVEIVHQVRRAPVEMRQDGGRIGGDQSAHHQADPAGGQEFEHRRKGDVVADQVRIEMRESLLDVGQLRIDDERSEADQNPRPRAQHVMRQVEEQRAAQRVLLGSWTPACAARCSCRRRARRRDTRRPTIARRSA